MDDITCRTTLIADSRPVIDSYWRCRMKKLILFFKLFGEYSVKYLILNWQQLLRMLSFWEIIAISLTFFIIRWNVKELYFRQRIAFNIMNTVVWQESVFRSCSIYDKRTVICSSFIETSVRLSINRLNVLKQSKTIWTLVSSLSL